MATWAFSAFSILTAACARALGAANAARISIPLLVALSATLCADAQGIRPDSESAREYGRVLMNDFSAQGLKAILSEFDQARFAERTTKGFGMTEEEQQSLAKGLTTAFSRIMSAQLQLLEGLRISFVSRTLALKGERVIECVFSSAAGDFKVAFFSLETNAAGKIQLSDIRILGSSDSLVQALRKRFLMAGVTARTILTDQSESDLETAMRGHTHVAQAAFAAMEGKNFDYAFRFWERLPPEIQRTPAWSDVRAQLMFLGSALASRSYGADVARGVAEHDSFATYAAASRAHDIARTLKAIDAVLNEQNDMPFLRVHKIEWLIQAGRISEAGEMARQMRELNPLFLGGHLHAILIAVREHREQDAIDGLMLAVGVMNPTELDNLLSKDSAFDEWRRSAPYRKWLEAAVAHQ